MDYEPIFHSDRNEPPEIRATRPSQSGEGVLDELTFHTIEVDQLFDVINASHTVVGQAVLYRSLAQPLNSLESIQQKQAALRELESNPELRQQIESLLERAGRLESELHTLFYGTFLGMIGTPAHPLEFVGFGYEPYRNGTQFMLQLVDDARALPTPESDYLKTVVEQISGFAETRWYSLMAGPAYKTEKGFRTRAEKGRWTPAIQFKPTLFKPMLIVVALLFITIMLMLAPLMPFDITSTALPVLMLFAFPSIMLYVPIVGTYDRDSCILPLRNDFKRSSEIHQTLEALGRLDELWSFYRYGETQPGQTVVPTMVDSEHHIARLTAAKNPVLSKRDPDYVANDIDLAGDASRMTFISGPNSGGKTATCKTITQIQLLAQIGCRVPAASAELAVADRIFYQVPEFSSLSDGEGRFGTELKRTKVIFEATSRNTLVILDELAEGTTYEEKLETSANVLNGFYRKHNTTILITHNHQLIDQFMARQIGQALQVEFAGDHPTFRLIEGISRVSHADRVAKKIGFSKEDIDNYFNDDQEAFRE